MMTVMYMRCIHAGVRSRIGEPNLLAWYQIYGNADACLRDDRMGMATLVWGWRVVESVPWYRSSRPLALFSLTLNPLTSFTPFHVREFRLAFG